MMTTLKCEELIEFSPGSLPSASFGAVLQAVTAETPITDQVPLGWLLTVTSKLERARKAGEGEKWRLKGQKKVFGCSAIAANEKPKNDKRQAEFNKCIA